MSDPDLARIRDDYARQSAEWKRLSARLAELPSGMRIVVPAPDEGVEIALPAELHPAGRPLGLRG